MEKIKQKYTVESICDKENVEFVFFWGHRKSKSITKSCFSQWYDRGFVIEGIRYNCAEQYMMAQKAKIFGDEEIFEMILKNEDPKEIKALGRKVRGYDPAVWDENKFSVVYEGSYAKFTQNDDLKEFLLSTDGKILVEASPYDKIWGIGLRQGSEGIEDPKNWKGTNLLGFALTQVRDDILGNK